MGSHPTLDHPPDQQEPTARLAERTSPLAAEHAFARLNPTLGRPQDPLDPTRRTDVRDQEDVSARGYRVAHADWTENDLPRHQAIQQLRDRAQAAHPEPEHTFDRLNPDFGVPADRTDRLGHRDVAQREAALALGIRVAIHDQRQNDPNPIVWQPGQDYRMADAIQRARAQPTRTRWGPERLGPER